MRGVLDLLDVQKGRGVLTLSQQCTLIDLQKMKIALHLLGVERQTGHPVVWIRDQVRRFPMAIQKDGSGRPPSKVYGVRKMTVEEEDALPPRDADILLAMPGVKTITPDLLQEVWLDGRR